MTDKTCAVPGCVAFASGGAFCAAHRWAVEAHGRRKPSDAQVHDCLQGLVRDLRRRYPRMSPFLLGVERLPLPLPCLLDFEFNSPRATLIVADSVDCARMPALLAHELTHLARQIRRYRRRDAPGAVRGSRALAGAGRFVPWEHLESGHEFGALRLTPRRRHQLAGPDIACPTCARPAQELEWAYVVSPGASWAELGGYAGWLSVCERCREQVAFYIDKQN